MSIAIDNVGYATFAEHLFEHRDELMALHRAKWDSFRKSIEIVAQGPGTYVTQDENFTAEMLGPQLYEELMLPVYADIRPIIAVIVLSATCRPSW